MNKILTSLFILFFLNAGFAQGSFEKQIGSTGDDYVFSIQKTIDSGFIVSGLTNSFGAGGLDIFLTKFDSTGNITWSKTYGGLSDESKFAVMAIQTTDGNYVVTGHTESFGAAARDGLIFKVDQNGNILWNKRYSLASNETFRGLDELYNGDLVIGGSVNGVIGSTDAMLLRITPSGTTVYSKIYGGSGIDNLERVKELPDSNLILVGNISTWGPAGKNFCMIKTDNDGNVIWEKVIGGTNTDAILDIEVLNDGSFITAGGGDSWGAGALDGQLMKTDANGNLMWIKSFGGSGDEEFKDIMVLPSGNLLTYGTTTSFGAGQKDLILIKTNSSGNLIWAKTYGGTGSETLEQGDYTFTLLNDMSILIGGSGNSFGTGDNDGLFIKTDTSGNQFCEDVTSQLVLNLPSPTSATSSVSISTAGSYSNPSILVSSITMPESDNCQCPPFLTGQIIVDSSGNLSIDFNSTFTNVTDWWWDFGDNQFSNLEKPTHHYNEAGTFWVCLTVTGNCGNDVTVCDSVTVEEKITQSILDSENSVLLNFYPNPSNGMVHLELNQSGTFRLLNLNGEIILNTELTSGKYHFDWSNYPAGMYLVEFSNATNFGMQKIVLKK